MTPIERVLFLGQSCAAAMPPLAALIEAGFTIPAVVLARPVGTRLGEIQRFAASADVPVVWVKSAAEATETIQRIAPEVAVAACFPWRLPHAARETPRLGILNVHPSLLPAGRGPEPVFWTLRRGERMTGVTVHRMDAGFDTGPIVAQAAGSEDIIVQSAGLGTGAWLTPSVGCGRGWSVPAASAGNASTSRLPPSAMSSRSRSGAAMPSGTSICAWATIGPVSKPGSMRWTVTPVIRSPRRKVQNTGSGPRPKGRSEGWTLRMPSGGVSSAARGSRQGKQAATATSGAMR